jgi:allophanate hydrolase
MPDASFDLSRLRAAYASGAQTPATTIKTVLQRIAAAGEDGVWISRFPDEVLLEAAARLSATK